MKGHLFVLLLAALGMSGSGMQYIYEKYFFVLLSQHYFDTNAVSCSYAIGSFGTASNFTVYQFKYFFLLLSGLHNDMLSHIFILL